MATGDCHDITAGRYGLARETGSPRQNDGGEHAQEGLMRGGKWVKKFGSLDARGGGGVATRWLVSSGKAGVGERMYSRVRECK
jgi:hypothetical protein